YAHARILGIDASAALKLPGVSAVITGNDLKDDYDRLPITEDAALKPTRSRYPLAVEVVRYAGEAVAVVIANSLAIAEDAAAEILVDWEPLPVVTSIEQAAEMPAPFDDM